MRSIRPSLRRASSIASGRLVAATKRTSLTVRELMTFNLCVLTEISSFSKCVARNRFSSIVLQYFLVYKVWCFFPLIGRYLPMFQHHPFPLAELTVTSLPPQYHSSQTVCRRGHPVHQGTKRTELLRGPW